MPSASLEQEVPVPRESNRNKKPSTTALLLAAMVLWPLQGCVLFGWEQEGWDDPTLYTPEFGHPDSFRLMDSLRIAALTFGRTNQEVVILASDGEEWGDDLHLIHLDVISGKVTTRSLDLPDDAAVSEAKKGSLEEAWFAENHAVVLAYWRWNLGQVFCAQREPKNDQLNCRVFGEAKPPTHRLDPKLCLETNRIAAARGDGTPFLVDASTLEEQRLPAIGGRCSVDDCSEHGKKANFICGEYGRLEKVTWDIARERVVRREPYAAPMGLDPQEQSITEAGGHWTREDEVLHVFEKEFGGCSFRPFVAQDYRAVGCVRHTKEGPALVVWNVTKGQSE